MRKYSLQYVLDAQNVGLKTNPGQIDVYMTVIRAIAIVT